MKNENNQPRFSDPSGSLEDIAKVHQSFGAVGCGCSMIIPAFHFQMCAMASGDAFVRGEYPRLVTQSFMRDGLLDYILVQLRRLYDRDARSFSIPTIGRLLADDSVVAQLKRDWAGFNRDAENKSHAWFDSIIGRVYRMARITDAKKRGDLKPADLRTVGQIDRVRLAANKRAAHATLGDYSVTDVGIRDVILHVTEIARLLQQLFGIRAYEGDFKELDEASFAAAQDLFGVAPPHGLLLPRLAGWPSPVRSD